MAKSKGGSKHYVAHPTYAGIRYDCYGKRVKAGKGRKKVARVFCAKDQKSKK